MKTTSSKRPRTTATKDTAKKPKPGKRIPIAAARAFVRNHDLRYVVIFARGDEVSHVITFGNTVEESSAAAELGNKMKQGLGWPEDRQAWPPRVKRPQSPAG